MAESKALDPGYIRAILDAFPTIVLALNDNACIQEANLAASQFLGEDRESLLQRACGDVLRCARAIQAGKPCGETESCPSCVIRGSCMAAITGEHIVRKRAEIQVLRGGKPQAVYLLVSATPFDYQGARHALLVLEDVTELTELQSMVPICANCKKVRRDNEYWEHVEEYMREHMDVQFSHSICPECMEKLYPKT